MNLSFRCDDSINAVSPQTVIPAQAGIQCLRSFLALEKKMPACAGIMYLAERTGLEPATPGVTGRYSNQLNYHSETDDDSSEAADFTVIAIALSTGITNAQSHSMSEMHR